MISLSLPLSLSLSLCFSCSVSISISFSHNIFTKALVTAPWLCIISFISLSSYLCLSVPLCLISRSRSVSISISLLDNIFAEALVTAPWLSVISCLKSFWPLLYNWTGAHHGADIYERPEKEEEKTKFFFLYTFFVHSFVIKLCLLFNKELTSFFYKKYGLSF